MSLKIDIPCENELTSFPIGIFNNIKIISIPIGVEVFISFKETPNKQEIYPLSDEVSDLNKEGKPRADVREAYLTTKGENFGNITIICSQILTDEAYVDVKVKREIKLSDEVAQSIVYSNFISNGRASQDIIVSGNYYELNIENLKGLRFNTTDVLGMELNKNSIQFPINGSDEIFLKDITNIKFHNNTANDITLSLMYMGDITIFDLYTDDGYVNVEYIKGQ